jgi:hypothetical protein
VPLISAELLNRADHWRMGANVDGIAIAFPHGHLLGHAVDLALVVPANRAGEDDPIAFLVADTMVFDLFFEVSGLASHGLVSFNFIGQNLRPRVSTGKAPRGYPTHIANSLPVKTKIGFSAKIR